MPYRTRRVRGRTDKMYSRCLNEVPPPSGEKDLVGDDVPEITWRVGPLMGGDNVPLEQIKALVNFHRREAPISRDLIYRLVAVFTRQEALLSLRDLEVFPFNICLEWGVVFWLKQPDGTYTFIDIHQLHRRYHEQYRRRLFDPVCRESRCYFRHPGTGVLYPTTVAQYIWFYFMWKNGVLRVAVYLRDEIKQWRRIMRSDINEQRQQQQQDFDDAAKQAGGETTPPASPARADAPRFRRLSHVREAPSALMLIGVRDGPCPGDIVLQPRDCYDVVTKGAQADPDLGPLLCPRPAAEVASDVVSAGAPPLRPGTITKS